MHVVKFTLYDMNKKGEINEKKKKKNIFEIC